MSLDVSLHHVNVEQVRVFTSENVGGQIAVSVSAYDAAGQVVLWFDSLDDARLWVDAVGEALQAEDVAREVRAVEAAGVLAKAGLD